jgi:hypothetical protein
MTRMPTFNEPVIATTDASTAVSGESRDWMGVVGASRSTTGGSGVYGEGVAGARGVIGVSKDPNDDGQSGHGVYGETRSNTGGAGVCGEHMGRGFGVLGLSRDGEGVRGYTRSSVGAGVAGFNDHAPGPGVTGAGVFGTSRSGPGVFGSTASPDQAAVVAINPVEGSTAAALYAKKEGSGHAGFFVGNVWVEGELTATKDIVCQGADCAEDFDIAEAAVVEPGTVMVVGEEGTLRPCQANYDRRVTGVVSGAGDLRPAIVLGRVSPSTGRQPIALVGKVFCKVDADYAPIEAGDLLTTSDTPGHAMKVNDPARALGAVLGKALRPWRDGRGLILILVTLQ